MESNDISSSLEEFRYKRIFHKSPDPIMMLEVVDGMPTRYLDVNKTYAKSLGYSIEECLKVDPYTVMPQSFLDRLPDIMKTLYRDKRISYEVSRIAKDGSRIPVEVTIFLFSAKKHDVVLVLSHDITERKKAEIKFHEIFNKVSDAIVLTDPSTRPGRYIEVNDAFIERIGYTREELLNMSVDETFSGVTNPPLPLVYEALDKEGSTTFETEEITKDGIHIPTEVKTHKINLLGKDVLISISRDITERKKAESALKESEEKYRNLFNNANDAIFLLEVDDGYPIRVLDANDVACKRLEYSRDELLTMSPQDFSDTKTIKKVLRLVKNAFQTEEEITFEINHITKSGQKIPVEISSHFFTFKGKDLALSIARDITERKKTEQMRRELEQRRDDFVWMTSHELRTPLTVISGYIDFLLQNIDRMDHDQRTKVLQIIKRNLNRFKRLTDQVSLVAQFQHGTFTIKKTEFNFCTLFLEALEPYKAILKEQIDFDSSQMKVPIIIEGDEDRLLQVIDNLLSNAVKQTHPDNRLIKVNLETLPKAIRLQIWDSGAGIAQKDLERIFDQFVSVETEYSATGTGIGLYLSRKIMEAHGGTIKAQSEGKGLGSVFTIELPTKFVES